MQDFSRHSNFTRDTKDLLQCVILGLSFGQVKHVCRLLSLFVAAYYLGL